MAEPAGSRSTEYAGLVSRVCAIVIDVVLLTVGVLVVGSLPPVAAGAVLGSSPTWLSAGCAAAAAALPWLYFAGSWWLTGKTVGGLFLGVRVQRTNGNRVGPLRALVRAGFGLLLAPLWAVGLLLVLAGGRRRALHDRVFGTVVRYTERPPKVPTTARGDR